MPFKDVLKPLKRLIKPLEGLYNALYGPYKALLLHVRLPQCAPIQPVSDLNGLVKPFSGLILETFIKGPMRRFMGFCNAL